MQKYLRKELISDEYDKESLKEINKQAVTAKQVKKDTTIETIYGTVLVTAGNYILTQPDKSKVGMAAQDFERSYAEWNK